MIRGVLFDFDGVLCQTETWLMDARLAYFQTLGLDVSSRELYRELAGGTPIERETGLDKLFQNQPRYREVRDQVQDYRPTTAIPLRELRTAGVVETLSVLRTRGLKLACVSNSGGARLKDALSTCELLGYFDILGSGYDLGRRKPDPYAYQTAMDKLDLTPKECIIVEDSYIGIQAGKASGALTLALRDRDGMIDQSEADAILIHLNQLFGYICS